MIPPTKAPGTPSHLRLDACRSAGTVRWFDQGRADHAREDVNVRIKQSQGQMQQDYTLHIDVPADREDGSFFRDGEVRQRLVEKRFKNVVIGGSREWMRCTADDVRTAVTELQKGLRLTGTHHETFQMRREQAEAVRKTYAYFHSIWKEDGDASPRFLWNAKMRFGKTFTAYQLAKKLDGCRPPR